MTYEVTITVELSDVQAESKEAAIEWTRKEIESVLDFGTGGLRFHGTRAFSHEEEP